MNLTDFSPAVEDEEAWCLTKPGAPGRRSRRARADHRVLAGPLPSGLGRSATTDAEPDITQPAQRFRRRDPRHARPGDDRGILKTLAPLDTTHMVTNPRVTIAGQPSAPVRARRSATRHESLATSPSAAQERLRRSAARKDARWHIKLMVIRTSGSTVNRRATTCTTRTRSPPTRSGPGSPTPSGTSSTCRGAAINPERGVFGGGLGFKGAALISRTTDGGATWSEPERLYNPGGVNQTIGNQIVVQPDGPLVNLFVEILNFRNDDGAPSST